MGMLACLLHLFTKMTLYLYRAQGLHHPRAQEVIARVHYFEVHFYRYIHLASLVFTAKDMELLSNFALSLLIDDDALA
jgi:hypothetical protein